MNDYLSKKEGECRFCKGAVMHTEQGEAVTLEGNDALYLVDASRKREYSFDILYCPVCGIKLQDQKCIRAGSSS